MSRPPSSPFASCRSCGAQVIWAQMDSGKMNPMDANPDPAGKWVIVATGGDRSKPAGKKWEPEKFPTPPFNRYTSHFSTCPNADQHRRSK